MRLLAAQVGSSSSWEIAIQGWLVRCFGSSPQLMPESQMRRTQWRVPLAFERGLLLLGCGQSAVHIVPPLNIAYPLVEERLANFEEALTDAEQTTAR